MNTKPIQVNLDTTTLTSLSILTVGAGTTGPGGGDSGHGGRSVVCLRGSSFDLRVRIDDGEETACDKLVLVVGGDCEMEQLVEALQFAADTLRRGKAPEPESYDTT